MAGRPALAPGDEHCMGLGRPLAKAKVMGMTGGGHALRREGSRLGGWVRAPEGLRAGSCVRRCAAAWRGAPATSALRAHPASPGGRAAARPGNYFSVSRPWASHTTSRTLPRSSVPATGPQAIRATPQRGQESKRWRRDAAAQTGPLSTPTTYSTSRRALRQAARSRQIADLQRHRGDPPASLGPGPHPPRYSERHAPWR
jgi:hypothetical protein